MKPKSKPIRSIHEWKMKFFPTTYRQELEKNMNSNERIEYLVRKSIQTVTDRNLEEPQNQRIKLLEEAENAGESKQWQGTPTNQQPSGEK